MKRILTFFTLALLLTNCTRDEVVQVIENDNFFEAESFEVGPFDFNENNGYENIFNFPSNVFIDDGDLLLVYLLWSENPDTWRLLPQTIYTDNGEFQYNFQDNFDNVSIFMDAPTGFDLSTLSSADTQDQFFRVVILPIESVNSNNIDVNNLNEVMSYIE